MKNSKTDKKKLTLNKITITKLNTVELLHIKGGSGTDGDKKVCGGTMRKHH